jgi:hypothetical protein
MSGYVIASIIAVGVLFVIGLIRASTSAGKASAVRPHPGTVAGGHGVGYRVRLGLDRVLRVNVAIGPAPAIACCTEAMAAEPVSPEQSLPAPWAVSFFSVWRSLLMVLTSEDREPRPLEKPVPCTPDRSDCAVCSA